jgi:hypothetical protein
MKAGRTADVRRACMEFLAEASEFYQTPPCGVRVLAARPLRVRDNWARELFGDYNPETMLIRVWMRTAVRKEVTSTMRGERRRSGCSGHRCRAGAGALTGRGRIGGHEGFVTSILAGAQVCSS